MLWSSKSGNVAFSPAANKTADSKHSETVRCNRSLKVITGTLERYKTKNYKGSVKKKKKKKILRAEQSLSKMPFFSGLMHRRELSLATHASPGTLKSCSVCCFCNLIHVSFVSDNSKLIKFNATYSIPTIQAAETVLPKGKKLAL